MGRLLLIALCLLLASLGAPAASSSPDLDTWVDRDLVPWLRQQLATLPRFRNESFRFVVLSDDSPQSEGSALAIQLRDRLRDSVGDVPGIRVAWQADQPGVGLVAGATSFDCTKNEANYFIGIELAESATGQVGIAVKALDIEERSWVAGFSHTWRGTLNSEQRRLLRQVSADPTFRGERDAPWDDAEADLMAAQLAYELGCELLRQTDGEYVITDLRADGASDPTTALVELVSNNLAGIRALQFSASAATANAVIEGKAHRIDNDLFQYWITITPTDGGAGMTSLSADAYVRIPDSYKAAMLVPEAVFDLPHSPAAFLSSLSVVRLRDQRDCLSRQHMFTDFSGFGRDASADCYALQVDTSDDAVVFFLSHQLNFGLVRLADEHCARQSLARVARNGEDLRFPLPAESLQSGSWSAVEQWSLQPGQDTYYVLAATDTKAARALSRHVESLPRKCSASLRSGLEGDELRGWLEELERISRHFAPAIDWQSVRIKEVY